MNTQIRKAVLVLLAAILLLPAATTAQAPRAPGTALEPLARLVGGEWRGQIKLLDGRIIAARHIFEWGLGQTILKSKTYGAVGQGAERLVYEGVFAWHPEKKKIGFREFAAHGGTNEGTIEPEGNALHYSWTEYSQNGAAEYRETLRFPDNDHYVSEAFKKTGDGWKRFAESAFRREATADAVAAPRTLRKRVIVAAPLAEVWKAWTTTEGVTSFFGPKAQVEARLGGPYEIYFSTSAPEGLRGSEGCKVQSVVPMSLFAFEWNAPPTIPAIRNSGLHTLVQLRFHQESPDRTHVEMTHSGWGEGEEWDKTYAYFDEAWEAVLGNLEYRFRVGPVEWPGHFIRAGQVEPAK